MSTSTQEAETVVANNSTIEPIVAPLAVDVSRLHIATATRDTPNEITKTNTQTPNAFQLRGVIQYTVFPSPFGLTLMAVSDYGLCALMFNQNENTTLGKQDLVSAFEASWKGYTKLVPKSHRPNIIQNDTYLQADKAYILELLSDLHHYNNNGLQLHLIGTTFQLAIYGNIISQTERGKTLTYGQISPGSGLTIRSTARACGSNDIAIFVACHRLISASPPSKAKAKANDRSDGGDSDLDINRSLEAWGGYRWGASLKAAIFIAEKSGIYP